MVNSSGFNLGFYTLTFVLGFLLMAAELKEENFKKYDFFVGTYTQGESKGIYKYAMDEAGLIKSNGLAVATENPSFLTFTHDRKYLLVVNENRNESGGGGTLSSFLILTNNELEQIDTKDSGGASPCFVAVNNQGYALIANYSSGTVGLLKINAEGLLEGPLDIIKHEGQGSHPRQKEPHAHSAWFLRNDKIVTVDLGANQLWFSTINNATGKFNSVGAQQLTMALGAGPRHLAIHPNEKWIYVLNELNSTVTLIKPNAGGLYEVAETKSTLPENFAGESLGADIRLSRDGNFLYASNRGHNSLAIFRIHKPDGSLTFVEHQSVHGDWPRSFALTPDDSYILVANQHSNNITSFKRDKKKGTLQFVHEIQAHSPVCILF
ncbi:MAG: lactonase family protein [Cyclobacteriaceae bacterium]|nr:lactonase family protein [Cyclobacteriaceae bacterium]